MSEQHTPTPKASGKRLRAAKEATADISTPIDTTNWPTEISPRPWHLDREHDCERLKLTDADGEYISIVSTSRYHDERDDPVAQANAEHIVRCVNAHDELGAVARNCELSLSNFESQQSDLGVIARVELGRIRAALAKVAP